MYIQRNGNLLEHLATAKEIAVKCWMKNGFKKSVYPCQDRRDLILRYNFIGLFITHYFEKSIANVAKIFPNIHALCLDIGTRRVT